MPQVLDGNSVDPGVIEAGLRWFVLGAPPRLMRVGSRGELLEAMVGAAQGGGDAPSRLRFLRLVWREMKTAMAR